MDTPDSARKDATQGRLFSNTDLSHLIRAFDFDAHWSRRDGDGVAYFETEGFARLVKAVSKGDVALQDQILRLWRVR